jgi:pimeloyl-ACP methyl ester carboxylesterase
MIAQKLKVETKEAWSTLRQVSLMHRDLSPVVPATDGQDNVVVFVHGFFASAGVFRPLRNKLAHELRAKSASFTYLPGFRIEAVARKLSRLIDDIPFGPRIHIVGHSLGGLIARWYVQELGGHARVSQTISLGSPFAGTKIANPFPILVGRDLRTQSDVLARLRARAAHVNVPHTSVVGQADRMVVPQHSAVLPTGDVAVFSDLGHNALLYDARVHDLVTSRIKAQAMGEHRPSRDTQEEYED